MGRVRRPHRHCGPEPSRRTAQRVRCRAARRGSARLRRSPDLLRPPRNRRVEPGSWPDGARRRRGRAGVAGSPRVGDVRCSAGPWVASTPWPPPTISAHVSGGRRSSQVPAAGRPGRRSPSSTRWTRRFTAMAEDHVRRLQATATVWGGLARFAPGAWAKAASSGEPDVDVEAVHAKPGQPGGLRTRQHGPGRRLGRGVPRLGAPLGLRPHRSADPRGCLAGDRRPSGAARLGTSAWRVACPHATLHMVEGEGHFLCSIRRRRCSAR